MINLRRLISNAECIRIWTQTRRDYHKHFDPKCLVSHEFMSLSSLNSNLMEFEYNKELNALRKIDLNKLRIKGVPMRLECYDSMSNDEKNLNYYQSMPTVLVLPNSEASLIDLSFLIGSLVEKKFRVLAFKFPGRSNIKTF